jgi:hypothetical protein
MRFCSGAIRLIDGLAKQVVVVKATLAEPYAEVVPRAANGRIPAVYERLLRDWASRLSARLDSPEGKVGRSLAQSPQTSRPKASSRYGLASTSSLSRT